MYITLEQVKKHLNVDEEFTSDDLYILDLITVSEDAISRHLNIALSELEAGGKIPPAITHAMLLMVGNLYANREPVSYGIMAKIPLSYEYLIGLYKKY
ncbi:MAG: DNA-packaging protein [Bacteroidetes bacterium 41-46]|nr:MAG: DNA-packaging protein [Bacteroidetes bacterium 41-46]